jgi:HK97 family phage major capsid protein
MTARRERDGQGWYRITNLDGGPSQILIYDEIGFWGVTAQQFLHDLGAVNGPVDVHINSPGGDVFDAYAIYNALVARPGVTTVVDSLAASAASVIAMAGEQRLMARTSQMMIHDAFAVAEGGGKDLRHMADRLDTVSGQIAGVYADTAGGQPDYWRGLMSAETWFTPQQAFEAGLITGITGAAREPAAAATASAPHPRGGLLNANTSIQPTGWDPDGDGDDDSAPQTDTDNSHWDADGNQTKSVPGRPMPGQPPIEQPTPNNQASAAPAPANNGKGNPMPDDLGALTIEGRRTRIPEITNELSDIAGRWPASVLPADIQAKWNDLVKERREHQEALDAVDARNAILAEHYAANPNTHDVSLTPGVDNGPAPGTSNANGRQSFGAPNVHIRGDIYNLGAIRQQASNEEQLPGLYRDYAMRAIEEHTFPGATKLGSSRETMQANCEKQLYVTDDTTGWVARRILATGSPDYLRAYTAALKSGRAPGGRDGEILNLGESDSGSFAVPFQLDPTVILVSNGAINPLRQISRVEQITGKEFDLVTSTGVTVSRKAEFAPETSVAPTLLQPTLQPKRVSAWIPFSVELEGDWSGLQASMMALLSDAKDVEESNSFTLGAGTGVTAGGVVTLQSGGSLVTLTGGVSTLSFKDPETLESAMAPRFRVAASYLASKTTYNKYRNLFAAQTGFATDPWNRPTLGQPRELWGYPAYEDSDMVATNVTGDKVLLMGDFGHGFLIVDRVGMNVELVPTVFGAAQGQFPTGTRGYFAWWRNNSTVLILNAFRLGVVG